MRRRIVPLALGCIASLIVARDGSAQSAYDCLWCAVYTKTSGATSCYCTGFQQ